MRELGIIKRRGFYEKFIGKTVSLIVEGERDASSGLLKGITSNYIPVFISGEDNLKNTIVNVEIKEIHSQSRLTGVLKL